MSRRRSFIPVRKPVLVGCEGQSECGYVRFLQDLINDANLPVHLMIEDLAPGAGNPLSRIEMIVRRLSQMRRTRIAPADRFALLDSDQADRDPGRADQARRLAAGHRIQIVWQRPCFEAMLLRHLPGRSHNQPPDSVRAQVALVRQWPGYRKPMSARDLGVMLDRNAVLRAAVVEPQLRSMLVCMGLVAGEAG